MRPLAERMLAHAPDNAGMAGAYAGTLYELHRLEGRTAAMVPALERAVAAQPEAAHILARATVA